MICDMCGGRGRVHNASCPDAYEPETEAEREAREEDEARREDYEDGLREDYLHAIRALEWTGMDDGGAA